MRPRRASRSTHTSITVPTDLPSGARSSVHPTVGRGPGSGAWAGTGISLRSCSRLVSRLSPSSRLRRCGTASLSWRESKCSKARPSRSAVDDDSTDVVIAVQPFHWFDAPAGLDEIAQSRGPMVTWLAAWNVLDERVRRVRSYWDVVGRHAGDTPRQRTMARRDPSTRTSGSPSSTSGRWPIRFGPIPKG